MDSAIIAKDIEKKLDWEECRALRRAFEKFAKIQGLDTKRSYHPNFYDDDTTEQHWITWLSSYAFVKPLSYFVGANS